MSPAYYLVLGAALAAIPGCDKPSANPPGPDGSGESLIGIWADLANAPETDPRVCCFYDTTREDPCAPDTLILRADGTLTFTSIPDEPSRYSIVGDTLYRIRGSEFPDTSRFAFALRHDTLYFPITPLCEHKSLPARFRKIPPE
jgi:hypothetical protein